MNNNSNLINLYKQRRSITTQQRDTYTKGWELTISRWNTIMA